MGRFKDFARYLIARGVFGVATTLGLLQPGSRLVSAPQELQLGSASAHLDHLHENGSTPYGFTFKEQFDAAGEPTKLDSAMVKAKSHK